MTENEVNFADTALRLPTFSRSSEQICALVFTTARRGSHIVALAGHHVIAEKGSIVLAMAGSKVAALNGSKVLTIEGAEISVQPGSDIVMINYAASTKSQKSDDFDWHLFDVQGENECFIDATFQTCDRSLYAIDSIFLKEESASGAAAKFFPKLVQRNKLRRTGEQRMAEFTETLRQRFNNLLAKKRPAVRNVS